MKIDTSKTYKVFYQNTYDTIIDYYDQEPIYNVITKKESINLSGEQLISLIVHILRKDQNMTKVVIYDFVLQVTGKDPVKGLSFDKILTWEEINYEKS